MEPHTLATDLAIAVAGALAIAAAVKYATPVRRAVAAYASAYVAERQAAAREHEENALNWRLARTMASTPYNLKQLREAFYAVNAVVKDVERSLAYVEVVARARILNLGVDFVVNPARAGQ